MEAFVYYVFRKPADLAVQLGLLGILLYMVYVAAVAVAMFVVAIAIVWGGPIMLLDLLFNW